MELDAILVVLEEWLIFGEIVYDLTRCGLDHHVCTVDETHDELRLGVLSHVFHHLAVKCVAINLYDNDSNSDFAFFRPLLQNLINGGMYVR